MGFKLGRERGLQANCGEVKNKMRFSKDDASIPGTPVIRKPLGEGIMGEANMDGSIYINENFLGNLKQITVINKNKTK